MSNIQPDSYQQYLAPQTATIAISGVISDAVLLYATTAVGLQTPAALTSTSFTFVGSIDDGSTFKQIRDNFGAAISLVVAVDGCYSLDPATFAPYDQIKIVCSAEAAERLVLIKPYAI